MKKSIGGIKSNSRKLLAQLLKATKESFTVDHAMAALGVKRAKSISLLSLWTKNGWLHRIKRGLYTAIPLESITADITPTEPWLIAEQLFSPCYIGGWSAAHYFGFTEQLFNTEFVMTTKKVHQRNLNLNGVRFKIKTITSKQLFGTQNIWRGNNKIAVSDPTKTIVDGLHDPTVLGGVRMLGDILQAYMASTEFNVTKLINYALEMDNSAIFKRLGFFLELLPDNKLTRQLLTTCKSQIKSGYSQLDPATSGKYLITRWNLWVPEKNWKLFFD